MPTVISFVSQKGGVGKSTLARAVAVAAAKERDVLLADLDPQQRTVMAWAKSRDGLGGRLRIEAFDAFSDAVVSAWDADLLVVDTPGNICDATIRIVRNSHLVVQPTSPSVDDLRLAVLVFEAMRKTGIPQERLVFALNNVLTHSEGEAARSFLLPSGFAVAARAIPAHIAFRQALTRGRVLMETKDPWLNACADALVRDLLRHAGSVRSNSIKVADAAE